MATAASFDASDDIVRDAIGLMAREQRLLAGLFKEFDLATFQQLDPVARRICKMLRVHLQIKEEILYPAARRVVPDAGSVDRSEQEMGAIRQSIMEIESLNADDAIFLPAIRALADRVAAHLQREQIEWSSHLAGTSIDLVAIGLMLVERRDTLMDVLGLHADDEEAAIYPAENPAIARAIADRQRYR